MVDGDMKQIQRVYKVINGEPVIVWDLGDDVNPNEYLKVYESDLNQEFLELNKSKYWVSSLGVYWVHEADGKMVETYLSTYEYNSWECDALEASYSTYDGKSYVDHYYLYANDKFGEYDMKITYKSPDTGNLLEVEYPIYYLQEVSWDWDSYTYNWYPFRLPFAYNDLCDAHLTFQCYDNDGNLVQATRTTSTNCCSTAYQYPSVGNAQFKIGDGQKFVATYISTYTFRTYERTISVNIRHYQDERNTASIRCTSGTTSISYYKDFRPTKITYKFDDNRLYIGNPKNTNDSYAVYQYLRTKGDYDNHGGLWTMKGENVNICEKDNMLSAENDFKALVFAHEEEPDDPDYYDYQNDPNYSYPVPRKTRLFFEFYKSDSDIFSVLNRHGYMETNNTYTVNLLQVLNETSSQICNSLNNKTHTATCGFAYWGDGTLSYVCLSNCVEKSSYTNATDTVDRTKFSTVLLRNGMKLSSSGDSTEVAYGNEVFENAHTYATSGTYDVEFTNFFGYESNSDKVLFTSHSRSDMRLHRPPSGVGYLYAYYYESISNSYDEDAWFSVLSDGSSSIPSGNSLTLVQSHMQGDWDLLPPLDETGNVNIIAFDFGETCNWGYGSGESWMNQVNFLPGYTINLDDCKTVTMPKITRTDSSATTPKYAVTGRRLETIYYEGSVSDFYSDDGTINSDFKAWVVDLFPTKIYPVGYQTTKSADYKHVTIQCSDGSLVLTN
jgi:hypothetical protein